MEMEPRVFEQPTEQPDHVIFFVVVVYALHGF